MPKFKIEYKIKDGYVIGIAGRSRKTFYCDLEDYELVKQYYWSFDSKGEVICKEEKPQLSMHHLIMGPGIYIHKNGNKADNRKENLTCSKGYKNEGKIILNGYIAIYMPDHPRSFDNGCVYEHILVAEKILGRELIGEECVHHKDLNRRNNSPSNLMIFKTNSDHIAYHGGGEAVLQEDGTYTTIKMLIQYNYNNETKLQRESEEYKMQPGIKVLHIKQIYDLCPMCKNNKKLIKAKQCKNCANKANKSKIKPSKEVLEKLIYEKSFVQIGREFGVTDNAVRKWCKSYGLPDRKKDISKVS